MKNNSIGNSELVSRVNRRLVLHAVRMMQPTFRAEVSRMTRLNPATVTGIVTDLLERNLLREIPAAVESGARGGRPPLMLKVNESYGHILAIDLEPDCIRVAVTNLLVEIVESREQLIDRFSEPAIVLRQIADLCHQVLDAVQLQATDLKGVALSLPGLIDRDQGILISSTNLPRWQEVKIGSWIEGQLGVRPRVGRSTHLAAIYEGWSHPAGTDETTLILSLRTGIGLSVLHRGELQVGWGGFDGEIGHTVVDLNGRLCECGSHGCLETFVSASAVTRRVEQLFAQGGGEAIRRSLDTLQESLRPELVYRLAKDGDPDCVAIVRDVGRYIGIAAANLVNLYAPDRLVLCGAIDTADALILGAVREQIHRQALPKLRDHVKVGLAAAKEKSPLLGAAALIARDFFALPKLRHAGPSRRGFGVEAPPADAGASDQYPENQPVGFHHDAVGTTAKVVESHGG